MVHNTLWRDANTRNLHVQLQWAVTQLHQLQLSQLQQSLPLLYSTCTPHFLHELLPAVQPTVAQQQSAGDIQRPRVPQVRTPVTHQQFVLPCTYDTKVMPESISQPSIAINRHREPELLATSVCAAVPPVARKPSHPSGC
jgi:hypothetical protein